MYIIPFTKKGYENLTNQLEKELSKRPNAVKELTRGREMGDLSENGLYKAAKQKLNDIDRKIGFLKNLVKHGKPQTPINNEYIQLGHGVLVKTPTGKKEFVLVGEYEANPKEKKISLKSPIGHYLMGRKLGEEIKISTPNGQTKYKILSISL